MMTMLVILLLLVINSSGGDHCVHDTSVDINEGERLENDTIVYNGTLYPPDRYISYENMTRGCICKTATCYRKCCGRNEIYEEDTGSCIGRNSVNSSREEYDTMDKYFKEFDELEKQYGLMQVNGFNDLNGCNNESCLFRTDGYKSHVLRKDGVLVVISVDAANQEIDVDNYCIDVMIYLHDQTNKMTLGREAYFRGKVDNTVEEYTQNYIAMLTSAVFILLTIAVHLVLPDLKSSLHGRNLLCHLCSMLVSFLFIAAMQIDITFSKPTRKECMVFSFVIYFSFLAAFFWLNVMCFDMWRKFRLTRATVTGDVQRRFRRYCAYAFGTPALLTLLLAVLEFSPIEDHALLPRMRKRDCFLSGNGKLIYLYIPILLICVANLVFFILTTIHIVKTSKKTQRHLKSEDSKNSKAKDKQRLLTYVKLFIVMGISWIMEVVSYIFPEAEVVWKICDLFNALSGLFIFIIVVCNKEKFLAIRKRFREIFNIKDKMGSTITLSTDLSQNLSRNSENAQETKKQEKISGQVVSTSENRQNSKINQMDKSGTSISQAKEMNKCVDKENYETSDSEKTTQNTALTEEKRSEMLQGNVYEIKTEKNDENLEKRHKSDVREKSEEEKSAETGKEIISHKETLDSDRKEGLNSFETNAYVNKSYEEETDSQSGLNKNSITIPKINENNVLRGNINEKWNENEYNVIEENEKAPDECLAQVLNNNGVNNAENALSTHGDVSTIRNDKKEVFDELLQTRSSIKQHSGKGNTNEDKEDKDQVI